MPTSVTYVSPQEDCITACAVVNIIYLMFGLLAALRVRVCCVQFVYSSCFPLNCTSISRVRCCVCVCVSAFLPCCLMPFAMFFDAFCMQISIVRSKRVRAHHLQALPSAAHLARARTDMSCLLSDNQKQMLVCPPRTRGPIIASRIEVYNRTYPHGAPHRSPHLNARARACSPLMVNALQMFA